MANKQQRLIPDGMQRVFVKLLTPLISIFAKWNFNPNAFTFAGVFITALAAAAFLMGYIRLGGIFVLLGGLCDTIDGNLARSASKATRFGALFDSAVDRYAEFIMFFGLGAHFVLINAFSTSVVVFIALCGSIMVSYCRARAESLGFDSRVGIMQRPERVVFLGLGALIHPVALTVAVWLVAIFANFTALQRIRNAYKQDLTDFKQEAVLKT
jgi:CDP-diacylglycerol--glycerol-3-phosphate 3-phosphatidyltransferase